MALNRIQSPVKGEWVFMNPPGHHPDARDFVAVNKNGTPYERIKFIKHLFYKLLVTETCSWEKEIFSPFEGTVIKIENTSQDRMKLNIFRDLFQGLVIAPGSRNTDIKYFLGNHVVLKSKEGVYALFAHLRKDSITVSEGMKVNTGQLIAKVGNSGNTIFPHLHFQLMKESDITHSIPIPFVFESCQINNNGTWQSLGPVLPRNFQKFRV